MYTAVGSITASRSVASTAERATTRRKPHDGATLWATASEPRATISQASEIGAGTASRRRGTSVPSYV